MLRILTGMGSHIPFFTSIPRSRELARPNPNPFPEQDPLGFPPSLLQLTTINCIAIFKVKKNPDSWVGRDHRHPPPFPSFLSSLFRVPLPFPLFSIESSRFQSLLPRMPDRRSTELSAPSKRRTTLGAETRPNHNRPQVPARGWACSFFCGLPSSPPGRIDDFTRQLCNCRRAMCHFKFFFFFLGVFFLCGPFRVGTWQGRFGQFLPLGAEFFPRIDKRNSTTNYVQARFLSLLSHSMGSTELASSLSCSQFVREYSPIKLRVISVNHIRSSRSRRALLCVRNIVSLGTGSPEK